MTETVKSEPALRPPPAPRPPHILVSADLLRGNREVGIRHGEDMYRLRLTAAGKLILTK
ncbi:hemin uptake protein HemP [Siccirubricoccus phaeus]|uniref:hemin uptake protein HemP n=1 Tax=Siccirubricoccus phaeus TaxID=2595053 RepID=UPI0011F25AFD|nr:hemin uptake protein HemP [Siccirubricoccus phaeus]